MGDFFMPEAPSFYHGGLCPDCGVEITQKNKRCAICAATMRHRIDRQVARLLKRRKEKQDE